MSLNNYFDHIYCLNLLRRPDRKAHAQEQFNKYGIGVEFWDAIDGKEVHSQYTTPLNAGELGIVLSNIEILKDAKERGYQTIAIVEDDITFGDEINKIDDYFASLPYDCDMLYLSANNNTHVQGSSHPIVVNERVFRLINSYSTHFIGLQARMYDVIIDRLNPLQLQLDVYYAQLQKEYKVYCFRSQGAQPLATQKIGFSDIINTEADYSWLIK